MMSYSPNLESVPSLHALMAWVLGLTRYYLLVGNVRRHTSFLTGQELPATTHRLLSKT